MNYHDRWFVVRSVGLSPFPKKSAKLQFHDPNGVLIIAIVIIVFFPGTLIVLQLLKTCFPPRLSLACPHGTSSPFKTRNTFS